MFLCVLDKVERGGGEIHPRLRFSQFDEPQVCNVENGDLLVLSSKLDRRLEVGKDPDRIKVEISGILIQPPADLFVVRHRMLKHLFSPSSPKLFCVSR